MGYVLLWAEGLAVALLAIAIAARGAAAGSLFRAVGLVLAFLVFFFLAALAVHAVAPWQSEWGQRLPADLFVYSLSWLFAYLISSAFLLRRAFQRPAPGVARAGTAWSRKNLWLSFGIAVLAFGLTFWNLDLAMRAELAVARQEAGDLLLTMTPPPVPDSENARHLYVEAGKTLVAEIREPWHDAAWKGMSDFPKENVDWKDPYIVALVAHQEEVLALLRKAAAMPPSNLDGRHILDSFEHDVETSKLQFRGLTLLAVDARVKAAQGNLGRAFEDIAAMLGFSRHAPIFLAGPEHIGTLTRAWRTLEDVLRLASDAKQPLPPAAFPDVIPALQALHRERVVFAMIWPAALQNPFRIRRLREDSGPWAKPPLVYPLETLIIPSVRVFLMPAELQASRRTWEEYHRVLKAPGEGTPQDWAALRNAIQSEPTGILSAFYMKPKEMVLLRGAGEAAALKQLAHAGLAATRFRQKHGHYPERLEQLVPDFLRAAPTDPRDGQVLQMQRFPELTVLYTLENNSDIANTKVWDAEKYRGQPVFRLFHSEVLKPEAPM